MKTRTVNIGRSKASEFQSFQLFQSFKSPCPVLSIQAHASQSKYCDVEGETQVQNYGMRVCSSERIVRVDVDLLRV